MHERMRVSFYGFKCIYPITSHTRGLILFYNKPIWNYAHRYTAKHYFLMVAMAPSLTQGICCLEAWKNVVQQWILFILNLIMQCFLENMNISTCIKSNISYISSYYIGWVWSSFDINRLQYNLYYKGRVHCVRRQSALHCNKGRRGYCCCSWT